jgi:hypothetical protein
VVAAVAELLPAGASAANAATVDVTGTTVETSPGTCGEPASTGIVLRIHCVEKTETWAGDISGAATFDEAISLNLVTGEIRVSGTATITGCVDGHCGTLDSTWHGSGRLDLGTGAVILIQGEQRLTGGMGGLDGAKGSIRFELVGEGPATYEGIVVL